MIDINAEAEKSLSDVKCKAVFQYPKNFNNSADYKLLYGDGVRRILCRQ